MPPTIVRYAVERSDPSVAAEVRVTLRTEDGRDLPEIPMSLAAVASLPDADQAMRAAIREALEDRPAYLSERLAALATELDALKGERAEWQADTAAIRAARDTTVTAASGLPDGPRKTAILDQMAVIGTRLDADQAP